MYLVIIYWFDWSQYCDPGPDSRGCGRDHPIPPHPGHCVSLLCHWLC